MCVAGGAADGEASLHQPAGQGRAGQGQGSRRGRAAVSRSSACTSARRLQLTETHARGRVAQLQRWRASGNAGGSQQAAKGRERT